MLATVCQLAQEVTARLGEPDLSWIAARQSVLAAESVYGALHLVAAIAAARAGERVTASGLLDRAREAAERLGADRNDFWLTFGPTNVAIHDVAVLLELGDPAGALRRAVAVDPSRLPTLERQSSHYVRLAQAYSARRRDAEAVGALLAAERLNPEGIHYHMLLRDLVHGLLRRERRRATPGLRGLAQRLHLSG